MTNFKTILLAATAMTMVAGAAYAADNKAYVAQNGASNEMTIGQSGLGGNVVGADYTDFKATQNGSNNSLTVTQTGRQNLLGRNNTGENAGVDQIGDRNVISVTQKNQSQGSGSDHNYANNEIVTILQKSVAGGAAIANKLTIEQNDTGDSTGSATHNIGSLLQTNNAIANSASDVNSFTITQTGGGFGKGNDFVRGQQTGTSNTASLSQSGTYNRVGEIRQIGSGNQTTLSFSGTRNGTAATGSGVGALNGVALASGAVSGKVVQDGTGNVANISATGNSNQFGVSQTGSTNSVGTLVITGSRNELGVNQNGSTNVATVGVIAGDDNQVGIKQNGTNALTLDLYAASSLNDVSVTQDGTNSADIDITGNSNAITLGQGTNGASGGVNTADLDIVGAGNLLNVQQNGGAPGNQNNATVSIKGDNNNTTAFNTAFFGASSLTPGSITQTGNGNKVSLAVGTGASDADNNTFAFSQTGGNNNTINGVVRGNGNQALVVQVGSANLTSFSQVGSQNFMSVKQ